MVFPPPRCNFCTSTTIAFDMTLIPAHRLPPGTFDEVAKSDDAIPIPYKIHLCQTHWETVKHVLGIEKMPDDIKTQMEFLQSMQNEQGGQ